MTKQELEAWAVRHGYTKGRTHYVKEVDGKRERLVISSIAVRLERQFTVPGIYGMKDEKRWSRLRSSYLRDLSVDTNDLLIGMKVNGCQPLKMRPTS